MSDDQKKQKNEFDEFADDEFDVDNFDEFDDLANKGTTLGDLWRNNPFIKIGVILGALALLILGIIIFGGKKEDPLGSQVASSDDVSEAPGTAEVTEAYRQAVEEENTRRIEEAVRQSESAVPMPIEPPRGTLNLQEQEPEEEDPLERWRRMQEERIRQQQIQLEEVEEPPEPEVDTRTPAVNALAQAMSQQMEAVLGAQQIEGPQVKPVATISYLEGLAELERQRREEALAARAVKEEAITDRQDLSILLPAGSIEYAQLITEANTDAPGPILAQIATGPLKGARIIGSFQSTDNYITMSFNTIILDGVDYSANAVAIDPKTTLPGMVTDIDRRYFKRVVLPMAAEFVTSFTQAIADSGRTSITISGDSVTETTSNTDLDSDQEVASGIAAAGQELADILDDAVDDVEPLLRVRAGTPIGLLFVSSVVEEPRVLQQQQQPLINPVNLETGQIPVEGGTTP